MDIKQELKGDATELCIAKLAIAFALLAETPYDNWRHEGNPAEMAVYVVNDWAKKGRLGFLWDILEVG